MFQLRKRVSRNKLIAVFALYGAAALLPALMVLAQDSKDKDILYIADVQDNSIKRFDAETGRFLDKKIGALVSPGSNGLDGPRGMIIDKSHGVDDLIVVNQNVDQNFAGEVLSYAALDGQFLGAKIPCNPSQGRTCDPNAPFDPRGIVRSTDGHLFVADIHDDGLLGSTGRVLQYDAQTGHFLGSVNQPFADHLEYSPRALVFGPDGMLYVSLFSQRDRSVGFILRFDREKFVDVFASNGTCSSLHRPDGLAFGPDGKLYVTSFRLDPSDPNNPSDTDKILIFDLGAKGSCPDKIDLDKIGDPHRAFAEALLFGPGDGLFVPMSNTGEVRRYNVRNKHFESLVPAGGGIGQPWYLTFGKTDPGTLAYRP